MKTRRHSFYLAMPSFLVDVRKLAPHKTTNLEDDRRGKLSQCVV